MSRAARLGAFILVTLAILVVGVFIIGGKQYLFSSTYTLKTEFSDVAGLEAGADVLVGGVHSGTIRTIELPHQAGQKITVTMEMDKTTHDILKKDSVASIQTEGLLGNQFLSVSFGSAGQPELKSGDMIGSVPPFQMAVLMDKMNGLLTDGQKAMVNIAAVSEHLNSVTAKVDSGAGTVGALINDRALYDHLNQTATTLNATAGSAQGTVVEAQKGVTSFTENMEALKHNFLLSGYFKKRGYEDESELGKDEIAAAPEGTAAKEFSFQAKDLFDKQDSAKFKGQKTIKTAGEFLAGNDFGVAVIEVSTGGSGASDADMTLAEGRALVVRDYLAQHFSFDDTKLKTLSLGKQVGEASKDNWGLVKVLIYPAGTPVPPAKNPDKTPVADAAKPAEMKTTSARQQ